VEVAMAIKIIKYEGAEDVLAWKYPSDELSTWTQLIVNQSQEALLYLSGEALDLFGPGRHTLKTENIPLLGKIVRIPFKGETPFKAEVWYVNRLIDLDIKWGTQSPIQLQDPKYKIVVPVRSFGQFGIQIDDSRKFLVKLVGTSKSFDKNTLIQYFRGIIMTKIKDLISEYLILKRISILEINAYIDDLSQEIGAKVNPIFEKYGVKVHEFAINSINVPEEDPSVVTLRRALAKKAEMDIIGYSYRDERSFNTMDKAASNESQGAGLMNAGLGLGMGAAIGQTFGKQMNNIGQTFDDKEEEGTIICPKCKTHNPTGSKFCGSCGYNLKKQPEHKTDENLCPKCQASNPPGAKFCSSCGSKMQLFCPSCNYELQPGAKFCPNCGQKL